jgi:peptidyl-prolyl cis-trans isomerase SurA
MRRKLATFLVFGLAFPFASALLSFAGNGQEGPLPIDRILAVVNEDVITLTDVRIAEAFNILSLEEQDEGPLSLQILNRFIDQKIILQMTAEQMTVSGQEVNDRVGQVTAAFTPDEMTSLFGRFGITLSGLREYIRESLLYEKAIYNKFSRSVFVSLKEIENYYQNTFVPARQLSSLEVPPMLDILDDIETAIRKEKISSQVREWLRNLRDQANIQIKDLSILRKDSKDFVTASSSERKYVLKG